MCGSCFFSVAYYYVTGRDSLDPQRANGEEDSLEGVLGKAGKGSRSVELVVVLVDPRVPEARVHQPVLEINVEVGRDKDGQPFEQEPVDARHAGQAHVVRAVPLS